MYQFLEERKVPWLWICQMSGLGERRHRRRKRNPTGSDEEPVAAKEPETPHGTEESIIPGHFQAALRADA